MQVRTRRRGLIDTRFGEKYVYVALAIVAIVSLVDFPGISLNAIQDAVSWFSSGMAQKIVRIAQEREVPVRSAITLASALVLSWGGFVYFIFSIPAEQMRQNYLLERKAWNYMGLVIGCLVFHGLSLMMLSRPAWEEFSARPDGFFSRNLDYLTQTDTGLGIAVAFLTLVTAYAYATLLKTIYAHLKAG
ncbi:hypothetical protein FXN65_15345 [Metapseudomonas lalkuanensis]|uniref:Uncharacterized protein n=1 Tax=Metapseudomonas lalkuanensis TaxID=2604832 RepID=A0A5J6QLC2_9GAMM|nr:hypothetical protein [Pseudomonas lalkuanensis]QEY63360.1 hypothetical protein FXN65_15345 [Pseudomonas lalkuanensis]